MTTKTTRRAVLAGSAAVAATPLASLPALTAAHPDAELLALGRELEEAQQAIMVIEQSNDDDLWDDIQDACALRQEIVHDIHSIPAASVEGLRVKVMAIEYDSSFPDGAGEILRDEWRSLADDIRRLAGKAEA